MRLTKEQEKEATQAKAGDGAALKRGETVSAKLRSPSKGKARDHAAKAVGASPRYVQEAYRVTDRYHPGTPVLPYSYPRYPAPDTLTGCRMRR